MLFDMNELSLVTCDTIARLGSDGFFQTLTRRKLLVLRPLDEPFDGVIAFSRPLVAHLGLQKRDLVLLISGEFTLLDSGIKVVLPALLAAIVGPIEVALFANERPLAGAVLLHQFCQLLILIRRPRLSLYLDLATSGGWSGFKRRAAAAFSSFKMRTLLYCSPSPVAPSPVSR
ncbi:hypothetical protein NL676_015727 [Syzygium grande]|nr:hypothetical protein NL676_015727 [Syzygium grande]